MSSDEARIRELIDKWLAASKAHDLDTVLSLMTDDIVFMTPGREPFGKEVFAQNSRQMANAKMDGSSEIVEIEILADRAWVRSKLDIHFTPEGGETMHLSGYVMSIMKKIDGRWLLARDANMLMPE